MMNFELHPRLEHDCFTVGRFELCRLLMMNDSQYPWFLLVPQRPEIREIFQLEPADRRQLMDESCLLAENLHSLFKADKINIAAIGNLVPQLHIHHIVRYQTDITWPSAVWGKYDSVAYSAELRDRRLQEVRRQLGNSLTVDSL